MATIVNNPTPSAGSSSNSGMGFLIGIVLLIAFFAVLFFYGLPLMRGMMRSSTPEITVPDQIDVNVNTPPQQQ